MPLVFFFIVMYINYRRANLFGVTMEFVGITTYFHIIQFFQNFKSLQHFSLAILKASSMESQQKSRGFYEVSKICNYYGKFSNGVTLFISKILCFLILLDSFNLHLVSQILLLDPAYIFCIVIGCIGMRCMVALYIRSGEVFSKLLLRRIKTKVLLDIYEADE